MEKYIAVNYHKDTNLLDFMSTDRHLLYIILHNIIFNISVRKCIFTEIVELNENDDTDLYYVTYSGIHIPNLKIYLHSSEDIDKFINVSYQINFTLENT